MQGEVNSASVPDRDLNGASDVDEMDPVDWLRLEYARRRSKNPSYSLRAFARCLAIPSGPLSEILARKRPLSFRSARRIAERLGLSVEQTDRFLSALGKKDAALIAPSARYRQLAGDTFAVISEWYHYTILSLMETEGFELDTKEIARKLGLTSIEVQSAVERLVRLGLAEERDQRLRPTGSFCTTQDIPSSALRRFHRSLLERAIVSLDEVPVDKRDVTSMTLAIDPKRLPEAKAHIKRFRRQMADLLEVGHRKEVYHLTIQLAPAVLVEEIP